MPGPASHQGPRCRAPPEAPRLSWPPKRGHRPAPPQSGFEPPALPSRKQNTPTQRENEELYFHVDFGFLLVKCRQPQRSPPPLLSHPGPVNVLLDGLEPQDNPQASQGWLLSPPRPSGPPSSLGWTHKRVPRGGSTQLRAPGSSEGRRERPGAEARPEQPGPRGGRKSGGRGLGCTLTGHQAELGLPDERQALSLAGLPVAPGPTPPSDRQTDGQAGGQYSESGERKPQNKTMAHQAGGLPTAGL